jgi:hypothetical protein
LYNLLYKSTILYISGLPQHLTQLITIFSSLFSPEEIMQQTIGEKTPVSSSEKLSPFPAFRTFP